MSRGKQRISRLEKRTKQRRGRVCWRHAVAYLTADREPADVTTLCPACGLPLYAPLRGLPYRQKLVIGVCPTWI